MQSKKWSIIEVITTTVVGVLFGYLGGLIIYPLFGVPINHQTILYINLIFVGVSLFKNYLIRRLFNAIKS
jgi:hypothetical protein